MVAKTKKAAAKKSAPVEEEDNDEGYDDLLNSAYGEVQREKMIPEGPYLVKTTGYKYRPKTDKASAQVVFFEKPQEPKDEEMAEAIAALADEDTGEEYDISINSATSTFWLGEPRDWQKVYDYVEKHGIDFDEVKSLSKKEVFNMVKGRVVIAHLKVENYNDRNNQPQKKLVATAFDKPE